MDVGGFRIAHRVVIFYLPSYEQARVKYYDDPGHANAAKAYLESRLRKLDLHRKYGVSWEEVLIEQKFDKEKLETLLEWVD